MKYDREKMSISMDKCFIYGHNVLSMDPNNPWALGSIFTRLDKEQGGCGFFFYPRVGWSVPSEH